MTIVRLWLGVTWFYGGWAKATDAGYLDPASPNYFGAQISGMIGHSPISFALKHMLEHATPVAWFVMLSEFAIGIAVLAGVALQAATLGGFSMAIILWLSVSFHVHPYFLSNDLPLNMAAVEMMAESFRICAIVEKLCALSVLL
jgi:thiosulfate dehydrogenase [quinone] large subunit